MSRLLPAAAFGVAAMASTAALGQTPASTELAPIAVTDTRASGAPGGSLTAPSVEAQRREVNSTAGSVAFIDTETYRNRYASTLRDVLGDTPGVYVQNRYSQELRLSVRGSGISRAFHTRGIEILQDGIPTNLADGSGDFYQIDPLAARSIEVYRGGNALAFGSSTLGGAINAVSPTAYTATSPNQFRLDVGSYGTIRGHGQVSRVIGPWDFYIAGTVTHSDGWRAHEQQSLKQFNANVGYRFNERVETRFFFGVYHTDVKLPGALNFSDTFNRPRMASAAALTGDQARNTHVERFANRTTFAFDFGRLDIDSWAIHKSLYHPIFQVIDQDGWTYGLAPRFTGSFQLGGFRNDVVAGGRFFGGSNGTQQYININGARGALTVDGRQTATNIEGYAENRFFFLPQVALTTGFKAFASERNYSARGGLLGNPLPVNAKTNYSGINPRVGLLYEPVRDVQVFANVTRSTDLPDFSDLTQTVGTTNTFVPLRAQDAWTFEAGSRGRHGRFSWDLTAYRAEARNQLLQFSVNPSIPASSFNAARTTLQGLELGGSFDLATDLTGNGDRLTLRQVWTHNDFRFVNDVQYRNNRIAGVPQHVLRTAVTYAHPVGVSITPSVDWVPGGGYVDFANTFRVPGYATIGLSASAKLPNGGELFFEGRNLTDRRYISDFATVQTYTAGYASFYPGQGRSVYGGARISF
jgi:iron complex outermembrane receptor protein